MKNFFLFLVLVIFFHAPVKSDDIRDFEIEGISIGDSVLDFFQKKKLGKILGIILRIKSLLLYNLTIQNLHKLMML